MGASILQYFLLHDPHLSKNETDSENSGSRLCQNGNF